MTATQKEFDMGTGLVEATKPEPSALQVAIERGADPQVLLQMMELQERYDRNRAAEAFGEAVTKFQSLCPVVHKSREAGVGNFKYSYASFDDVMRQALPALKECGLAVSFSSEHIDNRLRITCRIRHGTHFEDHSLTVPVPSDMKVNDTQKYGAALKYAQRYSFCAALNIVTSDEDVDAEGLHDCISQENAQEIERLLMETNSDISKFCKAYAIDRIADLPKSQYMQAVTQIRRKQKS